MHRVLLRWGIATGFSSDELSEEEVLAACMLGAGVSSIFPTVITLSLSEDMSEQSVGGPGPIIGHRSLTWWDIPSIKTFCALVTLVTHPTMYLVVHRPWGTFTHTWLPILKTARRWSASSADIPSIPFSCMQQR